MHRLTLGLIGIGSVLAQTCDTSTSAGEISGLSIGIGVLGAVSIVTCALSYLARLRQLRTATCPYCEQMFETDHIRTHLQTCEEHLKHYKANGRGSIARELSREIFYERVPVLP
jgi:hypothetical protein